MKKVNKNTQITLMLLLASIISTRIIIDGGEGISKIVLKSKKADQNNVVFRQSNNQDFELRKGQSQLLNIQANGETTWGLKANINYLNIKGGLYHGSKINGKIETEKDWQMVYFEPFESGKSED